MHWSASGAILALRRSILRNRFHDVRERLAGESWHSSRSPQHSSPSIDVRRMSRYRLGLIVNPVAGMGGSVGLKGTDGALAGQARSLGAEPVAGGRASLALAHLAASGADLEVLTCAGSMGADAARSSGYEPSIVHVASEHGTTAEDSRTAARRIVEGRPHLLLFAGGDGTARDLLPAVATSTPLLGVPAGVKMHSAVFAATARAAGEVARQYLHAPNRESLLRDAEIMDRDPAVEAGGAASPRLYGMVRTPSLSFLVPGAKAASRVTDEAALAGAVRRVAGDLDDARLSLLGPGSTMQLVKRECGFEGAPLGIDAVRHGRCIASDLDERGILDLLRGGPARIVISVVGGQGFLFGRGNQPLSSRVIRLVGPENIVCLASLEKLTALPQPCLLLDTGDAALDEELAGYLEVRVSERKTVLMPVRSAQGAMGD